METSTTHPKRIRLILGMLFFAAVGLAATTWLDPVIPAGGRAHAAALSSPGSFAQLVKAAQPSVVNISAEKVIKGQGRGPFFFEGPFGSNDPFREFFDRFFRDRMPRDFKQKSLGSGFIIDKQGFILTNNHVVEKTDEIKVRLADDREFEAQIVGRDPKTDLALIRIKPAKDLVALPLGDSDALQVGDWVVAIGNPYGLGNTVTAGIVSAKYRKIGAGSYDNFIQTDAPINPGNSGGPLLNTSGEVIGINSAIFTQTGGSVGIGFAIPINMAKDLLPQLKKGKVVRGWLGVVIQKVTPELKEKLKLEHQKGALVADVAKGGPAEKAGIERGDVIVSFDGHEIEEMSDLPYLVASTPVGKKVKVEVVHKGQKKEFEVKIGQLQEEKASPAASETAPDLGMVVEEISPELARNFGLSETTGLVVVEVEGNTPAAEAGFRQGDIILEMDQVRVPDLETFKRKIEAYKKGDTVLFLIKRGDATMYLTLKVQG
jgi:serine protease Do